MSALVGIAGVALLFVIFGLMRRGREGAGCGRCEGGCVSCHGPEVKPGAREDRTDARS